MAQKPLSHIGKVAHFGDDFCAHVQYRDSAGQLMHIYGPRRVEKERAEADLQQIRAAGAVGKSSRPS